MDSLCVFSYCLIKYQLISFLLKTHLLLQAGDTEAVIIGWIQELAQYPTCLSRLGGVAMSHALVGLMGQGEATSLLLMG